MPIVSGGGGGGSQPFVRVPLAFDTAGLAAADGGASTGVVAYTPTPGDAIVWSLSYFSVPSVGFDSPSLVNSAAFNLTFSDLSAAFFNTAIQGPAGTGQLDTPDGDTGSHMTRPLLNAGGNWVYTTGPSLFPDATPLRVVIDDSAQGDPGMTSGEGELVLYIIPAAS